MEKNKDINIFLNTIILSLVLIFNILPGAFLWSFGSEARVYSYWFWIAAGIGFLIAFLIARSFKVNVSIKTKYLLWILYITSTLIFPFLMVFGGMYLF